MKVSRIITAVLFLLLIVLCGAGMLHAQDDDTGTDGIPANCESTGPYANPLLFPRYRDGTLALINWSSGEAAVILEQNSSASAFWFVGWSPDCHYLAGGLGDGLWYTTIVWDALTGARMGTVEDAYRRPHFLTWSPRSDQIVVETRSRTLLWDLASGQQFPLTLDSGGWMARSFVQITWNYASNTLEVVTVYDGHMTFNLIDGRPIGVEIPDDEVLSVQSRSFGYDSIGVIVPPGSETPYGCRVFRSTQGGQSAAFPNGQPRYDQGRLILQDGATGDVMGVLDDHYDPIWSGWVFYSLSANCEYLFTLLREGPLRQGIVIRVRDSVQVHSIPRIPRLWFQWHEWVIQPTRYEWDPTLRYLFAQSYDGAQIWDSLTDSTFYVTTAEESAGDGYSVWRILWDIPNGRATLDMLYSRENRVIDLATGQVIP